MAYKRELIAQTKNLLTEIKPFSNTKVENGVVYQKVADTREFDTLKVQIYDGDTFVKNWGGNNQQIGKNTLTFTTDVLPTHTQVVFGLNGLTNDMTVTTPITLENNTTYTLSMDFINITQGEMAWTNSMLEKNSTATDYVPYGHLSSYKKLLKVSDVCQLLDKSKYEQTKTENGIIFTNNGDGTITVDGTIADVSGGNASFSLNAVGSYIPVDNTHKYLGLTTDDVPSGAYIYVAGWKDNSPYHWVNDVGFIEDSYGFFYQNTNLNVKYISISVGVYSDETALYNFNAQPQWFDLTEMYGAGNEPKTVAEFKAKFPNELYDYSPRCWVKSYKTGLIAETKNLFNINALTPYTPETLPPHTAGRYNGNIITKCDSGTSVSRSNKLLKELCPNMVAGEKYILHFDTNGTGSQANTIYLNGAETVWRNGETHVVTEAELNGTVFFYGNYPSLDVATISNFQIEKGTTATDYVPYGYL